MKLGGIRCEIVAAPPDPPSMGRRSSEPLTLEAIIMTIGLEALMKLGRYDEAIQAIERTIKRSPSSSEFDAKALVTFPAGAPGATCRGPQPIRCTVSVIPFQTLIPAERAPVPRKKKASRRKRKGTTKPVTPPSRRASRSASRPPSNHASHRPSRHRIRS